MLSFRRTTVNKSEYRVRIHWHQWSGSNRRSSKRSLFREGIGLLSEPFVHADWPLSWSRNSGKSCSGPMQSLREQLTIKKSVNLRIEHEALRSYNELTLSTSLIHGIASVGNLDKSISQSWILFFNTKTFVEKGRLSKWSSAIWSRCWSAP